MIIEITLKRKNYKELFDCSDIVIDNGKLVKFKDYSDLKQIRQEQLDNEFLNENNIVTEIENNTFYFKTSITNKRYVIDALNKIQNYEVGIYSKIHIHRGNIII